MPGLTARTEAAAANAKRLAQQVEELNHRDDGLHAEVEARRTELSTQERRQQKLQTARSRVDSAVAEERDHAAPARAWLEGLAGLMQAAGERETRAAEHIRSQDVIIDVCRRKMVGLQAKQTEWAAEREALAVEAAVASAQPPEACRAALRIAEDALRQQFPEDELRRRIHDAEQALTAAATRYQVHPEPARFRAEQLPRSKN
jgi:chromosome segregation ATPase